MTIKKLNDYVDAVAQQFPDASKDDIRKILDHGLRAFYMTNLYGADVLIKSKWSTMYVGEMFKSNKAFGKYWHIKMALKLRIKDKRKKTPFDGNYYIGISEDDYQKYNLAKKGRKKVEFDKVYVFRLLEEAELYENYKYFYKVPLDAKAYKKVMENYQPTSMQLVAKRNNKGIIESV